MNNKKLALTIIGLCILSIFIGLLFPKKDTEENKTSNSSLLNIKSLGVNPFKHDRILAVKIDGIISESERKGIIKDATTANYALNKLLKSEDDPSIRGIIIRINSPGGTVGCSQEIYKAILRIRKNKPVIVSLGDIAASGGYYIASACDTIFANAGTLTGSIGVITNFFNFTDLLNKVGVEGVTLKAGKFKDIGNSTRKMTEEEKKILQSILNNTYEQFLRDVSIGRKIPKEKIAPIAEGLIYTGEQAKSIGLVDEIGDYTEALSYTQKQVKKRFPELAIKFGKKDLPIEESWESSSVLDSLLGNVKQDFNFKSLLNEHFAYSRFQPLWLIE